MWTAKRKFTGVTDKGDVTFRPGDLITDADAKTMGLAGKSGLAEPPKKEAARGAETQQS